MAFETGRTISRKTVSQHWDTSKDCPKAKSSAYGKSPSPGCGGAANVSPYGAVDAAANDHGDKERKDTEPAVAVEAVAADAVVAESSRREWFLGIH